MTDESSEPDIVFVETRLDHTELRRLVERHFEDMVKYVVDVTRGVAAVGGELHADEAALLLEDEAARAKLREITFALIGRGEPLE